MHDLLIVGGGVIGLSLAYESLKHGLKVALLERGLPGQEASWAGAGILPATGKGAITDPLAQLEKLSAQLHGDWAQALLDETGIHNGYDRCGGIHVARDVESEQSLAEFMEVARAQGIHAERIDRDELPRLEPALAPLSRDTNLRTACLIPEEAQLRNPWHLRALESAVRKRGGEILGNAPVRGILFNGNVATGVETDRDKLHAGAICVTAGAWTGELLGDRIRLPELRPIRGQMVLLKAERRPFQRIINEALRYLVPRDDGHVLVGSTVEDVGFDKRNTAQGVRGLLQLANSLVPNLGDCTVEKYWAGLRPATRDGLPCLGEIAGLKGLFIAAGHFRAGLFLSPGTAVVMSQLIRGDSPEINLSPFRADRAG